MRFSVVVFCLTWMGSLSLSAQRVEADGSGELGVTLLGEVGKFYTIERSLVLDGGWGNAEEFEGLGGEVSGILAVDPAVTPSAFFRVTAEDMTAVTSGGVDALFVGKTVRGYNFLSGKRWFSFGLTGDWSYEVTSAQTGVVTLTYDDRGNNPLVERDEYAFDFGGDGNLSSVDFTYQIIEGNVVDENDAGTLDLTTNSFAPDQWGFPDLLVGKTISQTHFTSSSRFIWDGSETGDWSFEYLDKDRICLQLTYDEDGNDPGVYYEETVITFNGTQTVSARYREYDFGSLSYETTVSLTLEAD